MHLTLDSIVKVDVAIASVATISSRRYDVGLIIGPSSGIGATTRAKTYANLDSVADDFESTDPEYVAAAKYFGVSPTPRALVIGYAGTGETPAQVISAIRDVTTDWYGVYWCGASATDIIAIDVALNALDFGMVFYPVTGAASSVVAAEPLVTLNSSKSARATAVHTATATEAAAVLGVAMGCAGEYSDSPWQLCYRTIVGMTPDDTITENEITTLRNNNVSVYVTRGTNRNLYERGATSSGLRVDEVINIDRISADIRDSLVDTIVNNKLPQNDSTTAQFVSAITDILETFVDNGTIGYGIWRGGQIGEIAAGATLERGYTIYAESFDEQSEMDRAARKGMPISIGLCLTGSVESVVVNVTVQQ